MHCFLCAARGGAGESAGEVGAGVRRVLPCGEVELEGGVAGRRLLPVGACWAGSIWLGLRGLVCVA